MNNDIYDPKFEEGQIVRVTSFCSSEYRRMEGKIIEYQWNQFDKCFYYEILFDKLSKHLLFIWVPELDLEKC